MSQTQAQITKEQIFQQQGPSSSQLNLPSQSSPNKAVTSIIEFLAEEIIDYIVSLLDREGANNLRQACKQLSKWILPLVVVIKNENDYKRFSRKKSKYTLGVKVNGITLNDERFQAILHCKDLVHLDICNSCSLNINCELDFTDLKLLKSLCLSANVVDFDGTLTILGLRSLEKFSMDISRIDRKTFKKITGMHKRCITLKFKECIRLKSL
jgi:hypothetical protein